MKTYAINLTTRTKVNNVFDKVAINKYPIIVVCKDIEELKQILSTDDTKKFIKDTLKFKDLYESSTFFIREINNDKNDFTLEVKDVVSVDF